MWLGHRHSPTIYFSSSLESHRADTVIVLNINHLPPLPALPETPSSFPPCARDSTAGVSTICLYLAITKTIFRILILGILSWEKEGLFMQWFTKETLWNYLSKTTTKIDLLERLLDFQRSPLAKKLGMLHWFEQRISVRGWTKTNLFYEPFDSYRKRANLQ